MNRLAKIVFFVAVCIIVFYIIAMAWQTAEVRLYGWSQVSTVKTVAQMLLAFFITDGLVGGL